MTTDTAELRKENRALRKEAKKAERTPEQDRAALRRKVRIFYDLQRLRMQTAGRTLDRATEIELHAADVNILDARANNLHDAEKEALKDIGAHLSSMDAFNNILADKNKYRGIGPTLAGVLLSEIDIHRCDTSSALWRYAGLAPQKGARCKSCKDTLVPNSKDGGWKHEYKRKAKCAQGDTLSDDQTFESAQAEKPKKGEKLHYNKFLKTKLVGVMGPCLLKANSPWRKFYDDYKHRITCAGKGMSDGHRHNMANRYMVKMLLLEFWKEWRTLEGLEVRVPYQEQYLGHVHTDKPSAESAEDANLRRIAAYHGKAHGKDITYPSTNDS